MLDIVAAAIGMTFSGLVFGCYRFTQPVPFYKHYIFDPLPLIDPEDLESPTIPSAPDFDVESPATFDSEPIRIPTRVSWKPPQT